MDLTEGSETSAIINHTPGNYPKESLLHSVHGESLKSRKHNKLKKFRDYFYPIIIPFINKLVNVKVIIAEMYPRIP